MPSYAPMSTKGVALEKVTRALISKGAVELAPLPSPGFYSRLFVVWKTSGSWRPVIDLSHLNRFLTSSPFKMETIQSVLLSVRPGDWMVSINLKEAYLQIPVDPDSRKYLRFVVFGQVYQFRALCFGLASAPQVFTRVMAPVLSVLHSMGIRLCCYLDDWLIQYSSREAFLCDLHVVLDLCRELGIVVNPEKSNFVPSQRVFYLETVLDSRSFVASPFPDRIARLLSLGEGFLSSVQQPTACWQSLLGMLSSLTCLVPGGRLRMRSLQSQLHRNWDCVEDSTLVPWMPACRLDLLWWLDEPRLHRGVSLAQVSPDLDFWSDASDVGWRAHLGPEVVSGLWSPDEVGVSINARELLAVERGLLHFQSSLRGSTVAIYLDNSTAEAYLLKSGGTRSLLLNEIAQRILRWSELHAVTLAPQFIPGCRNVLALSLSRPHQILGSEWTLLADFFRDLSRLWSVLVDLFATSANHRCSVYFSPFQDPQSAGTDAFLHSWDGLLAYAFPPWSVIPRALAKLLASRGTFLTLVAPYWPQRPCFLELLELAVAPPVVLPCRPDLLFQPLSSLHYLGLLRL